MTKSLDTFKARYYKYKENPTVSALSLKGISKTKDVLEFAKKHHMVVRGDSIYYPKNKKLRRNPIPSVTGGKPKEYRGRGY